MNSSIRLVLVALLGAGCAAHSEGNNNGAGSLGDSGGTSSGGSASGGRITTPSSGGATGSGGSDVVGMGGAVAMGGAVGMGGSDVVGMGGMMAPPPDGMGGAMVMPPMTGGKALLVTGTIPLVGTDTQFEAAFKSRGLEVEIVQEKAATPANAEGKRVIMLSYGMSSPAFNAEPFTTVPVPIIVTEQNLLPRLKMSSAHGFTGKMTKLTFVSNHELAGGFPMGDLEVYGMAQEFFWGTPSAGGIRIAHIVGQPDRVTYFAYEKGAMMDGAVAPAKRVQFFHATHSPDPIDKNLYLNANGLKLLGVAIDWCLK